MALQLTRPLAIFDLETTGVDVANDRIVSLGAMIVGGATVEHRFNPGRPLAQVEQGYLRWMLGQDFPAELKTIIADALRGRFPTRTP